MTNGMLRPARLLIALRLRRLLNMATSSFQRKRGAARVATARKRGGRWILPVVVALLMTFSFTNMAHMVMVNLQCELTATSACHGQTNDRGREHIVADELREGPFSPALRRGLAMEMCLMWFIALLVPLASRELAAPDWDLEWLVTLPVRREALLWARVVERTVTNPTGLLVLWPSTAVMAWHAGLRWSAPLAAIAAALLLLALAAAVRTVIDTGLRLVLPPGQLRNLQAAISVVAMPLVYVIIALSSGPNSLPMGWARDWPGWTLWTPPGLVVQWLDALTLPQAAGYFGALAAVTALLLAGAVALLARQLAGGVVGASSRETARTEKRPVRDAAMPGTPLQRRELRLLARDRTFLVQSLVVPLVIIGSQMFFTGRVAELAQLGRDQALLASIAFGLGSYVLLLSAFQTINTEGQALWLLYTFPGSLERMLAQKARLWAVLALIYPVAVFAIGLRYADNVDIHLAARALLVALGIPLFALIAVALGVWASDPLSLEPGTRVRPTYVYLYSLLAALYGYALYTNAWPHRFAVVVMVGSLALALWQKARDYVPFLLDPSAAPPPRVSAVDGIVAGLLFFAVQAIAVALLHDDGGPPTLTELAAGFAIAGVTVVVLMRLAYWRMKTEDVPAYLQGSTVKAVGVGIACALPAIGAGIAYMAALRLAGVALPRPDGTVPLAALLALACVAAPLCEEFIFRGLLFGGLRRSLRPAFAIGASAALFAVVHPPLSMLPVFVLGVCTAVAYERHRGLVAPVVTHMLYNAAMIAAQG